MRKLKAFLVLILIPTLIVFAVIRAHRNVRDWTIDKELTQLAGYTESEVLELLLWVDPERKEDARKDIMAVFTKYWSPLTDEKKGKWALRNVFDKYGIPWES